MASFSWLLVTVHGGWPQLPAGTLDFSELAWGGGSHTCCWHRPAAFLMFYVELRFCHHSASLVSVSNAQPPYKDVCGDARAVPEGSLRLDHAWFAVTWMFQCLGVLRIGDEGVCGPSSSEQLANGAVAPLDTYTYLRLSRSGLAQFRQVGTSSLCWAHLWGHRGDGLASASGSL